MKNLKMAIAGFLISSFSITASAGLVNTDWKVVGDSRAFLHEETGLEWLKLSETSNTSINGALSSMGPSGALAGWRLATRSEALNVFTALVPYDMSNTNYVALHEREDYLYSLYHDYETAFDMTFRSTTGRMSRGLYQNDYADPSVTGEVLYSGVFIAEYSNYLEIAQDHGVFTNNSTSLGLSIYLVSDGGTTLSSTLDPSLNANNANAPINQVSAPMALGLLSLGLLGFARREKL